MRLTKRRATPHPASPRHTRPGTPPSTAAPRPRHTLPLDTHTPTFCTGRIASVFQSGTNTTPNRIRLDHAVCWSGADTIVFRKPGFLGVWHNVGHFGATAFWKAFGGTVADFSWV